MSPNAKQPPLRIILQRLDAAYDYSGLALAVRHARYVMLSGAKHLMRQARVTTVREPLLMISPPRVGASPRAKRRKGLEEGSFLATILQRLDAAYDYSGWHWQPDTPPDLVCIGAILVQHTNWSNVEHALERLRDANALSLAAIAALTEERLVELVRPAGTPTVKATRLLALAQLATEHGGLDALLSLPVPELRPLLLDTPGIGPETADAILLYAADRAVFEIDAYTIRIFRHLGLGPDQCRTAGSAKPSLATADDYHAWQRWFEDALAPKFPLSLGERACPEPAEGGPGGEGRSNTYRRYHALIVLHGKQTCRPKPRCASCCLLDFCPTGRENTLQQRTKGAGT